MGSKLLIMQTGHLRYVYLDNAATSFPKPTGVYAALGRALRESVGNPGRSGHRASVQAAECVFEVREKVARLFRLSDASRVVFTLNATHALNMAIKTTLRSPCHILLSDMEHNATLRPILHLVRKDPGYTYSIFPTEGDLERTLTQMIRPETGLIVSTLASNVTGATVSLPILSRVARTRAIPLIVDGSQAAGHMEIDLKSHPVDVFCAPGHKGLFGLTGVGFAIFCDDRRRDSFMEGGSGSMSRDPEMPIALPERFEAGTLPVPAIATLGAGIDEICRVGIETIAHKLKTLGDLAQIRLAEDRDVEMVGSSASGILSFRHRGVDAAALATYLDAHGICVRAGLHCAPLAHKKLGTLESGTVRVSFSHLNGEGDVDALADALAHLPRDAKKPP